MRYRRCCGRREISTGTTFLSSVGVEYVATTSPDPLLCRIRETLGTPLRLSAGSGSLTKSLLFSRRIGSTLRSGFDYSFTEEMQSFHPYTNEGDIGR